MEVGSTSINNIKIEGYRGDYIFETIEKTKDFYESSILHKWSPILCKPKIILDVGSNIGNHAIYWANHINPTEIYAFEPYLDNFLRLQNNILNNNLNNVIIPIQKGVGDCSGYASVNSFDESNLGGTSLVYTSENKQDTIQMIDLDAFIIENNLDRVDFVKIDTEEFELLVLKGMRGIISKHKPDIWVEVNHSTYIGVMDILKEEGYILCDIEQFNMLFLHPGRHDTVNWVDSNKILDGYFIYLEKTNQYYKNYSTAKKWLEERNKSLEQYKEKYQKKMREFELELKEARDLQDKMSGFLIEDVKLFDDQVNAMENIKQYVRKLQTQNSYLSAENQEYRRKFEKITGTWYGQILVKLYKLLQRVKRRIKRQK